LIRVMPGDLPGYLERLDVEPQGVTIMAKKGELLLFAIKDMSVGAANILKQDALSLGADLAVPKGVVVCAKERVEGLLIGTRRQLERLARKELAQPFGLAKVGRELLDHLGQPPPPPPKIMGIINATTDSFYPQSRFLEEAAVEAMEQMVEDGADIIDLGGMSSRPGSKEIPEEEELARVRPIIDAIAKSDLGKRVELSIDTYRPKVAAYALERGFAILNDITALSNDETARIAAAHGAKVVLMHMQGRPETMQHNPTYRDVVDEVAQFFAQRIERAHAFGIQELILDPGIGFGKNLEDNLRLIRDLAHFRRFGYELLVGASRKSMIDRIHPAPVHKRLGGTLAIHLAAIERGASIIRCHDVFQHKQAILVHRAIRELI